MKNPTPTAATPNPPAAPIELWDRPAVLRFFGGSRPLHPSTLYRGVNEGVYPKPFSVSGSGGGAVRWVRSECEAALDRMLAARDEPQPQRSGRGRPRRQRIA
jgi:predicted DNA-binding transcriptional regulator AlpA